MRTKNGFLVFLDGFSLRQLLYAWMTVVLAGCTVTLAGYGWIYHQAKINSAGGLNLKAEYLLLVVTLAGLALALALGMAISRSVTRQAQGMAELARHLEMRDFKEYPMAIPSGDLGAVAQAFIDMRCAIIGYETELRSTVAKLRDANHNLGKRETEALAATRAK